MTTPKRKLDANAAQPGAKRQKKATAFVLLDALPAVIRDEVGKYAQGIDDAVEEAVRTGSEDEAIKAYTTAAGPVAFVAPELPDEDDPAAVSRAAVMRLVQAHVKVAGTGFGGQGKWTATGVASGPAPKNAVRDLQLANQVSQALITALGLAGTKTTEIEAMLVNDRLVLSANEVAVVTELAGTTLNSWLQKIDKHLRKGGGLPERVARKVGKLMQVCTALSNRADDWSGMLRLADIAVSGHRWPAQVDTLRAALHVLANADQPMVDGAKPPHGATLLTDPAYAGRVIVVRANADTKDPKSHAEQNLALALVHSTHTGPAAIAGGKRPCTICYLSLCLARHGKVAELRFNEHAGGFWDGPTETGLHDIVMALNLNLTQVKEIMAEYPVTQQYVTDLHVDADRAAAVANLADTVLHREKATDTATPSQSLEDHWFDPTEQEDIGVPGTPENLPGDIGEQKMNLDAP